MTPPTLRQLVIYATAEPPADAPPNRLYKYPFVSSELLSTESLCVHSLLAEHPDILAEFLNFLNSPSPLNPTLAGYFSRVVTVLVKCSSVAFLQVVNSLSMLDKFIDHSESRAIAAALLSTLQNDHYIEPYFCEHRTRAVAQIASKLTLEASPELAMNSSFILSSLIMRGRGVNGWQEVFTSLTESFFHQLLDLLSSSQPYLVKAVAEVCSSVLTTEAMSLIPETSEKYGKPPLISLIQTRLPMLVTLLSADSAQVQMTSYGVAEPVLGETKIRLIELVSDMVKLKCPELNEAIAVSDFLSVAWGLVLKHHWNSILHQTFYSFADRLLMLVDCAELRASLIRTGIIEDILRLNSSSAAQSSPASDVSSASGDLQGKRTGGFDLSSSKSLTS
jgi:serine/threonine-protein phosphatase 6 regulatory subunit 3